MYDALEHLCSIAFPDHTGAGVLVMITVYSDATYNQPKDDSEPLLHGITALTGTVDNWRRVRKEWRQELNRVGLHYFRMSDFEYARKRLENGQDVPKSNPYYGLTVAELYTLFERLSRTFSRRTNGMLRLFPYGSFVYREDYQLALKPELKNDIRCSSEFIFNAYALIRSMANWADRQHYQGKILYVFASGDSEIGQLIPLFEYLIKREHLRKDLYLHWLLPQCLDHTTAMKDEPAIQMADILAYESLANLLNWERLGR